MSLFTYLFGKGYTGGPDFTRQETIRFDMDGIGLTVSVPASTVALPRGELNVNVPFRSQVWFDAHCKQMWNDFFVTVFGDLWAYVGPFWKVGPDRTFGVLDVRIAIKRTLPGKVLDVNNLDSLASAIHRDYEWYFEESEPGKYGQGENREVRRKAEEVYSKRSSPEESKRIQKAAYLKKALFEIPTEFDTRSYNEQKWLYYKLSKEPTFPAHYYCQPLDEHYYLYIRFGYGMDFRQYFHLWQADAEAAEQRIMETVRLTFPNRLPAPSDMGHENRQD